jgi:hypothetical protein
MHVAAYTIYLEEYTIRLAADQLLYDLISLSQTTLGIAESSAG